MKTQVNGNTEGVRDAMLARLDSLYNYELEDGDFLPRELMKILAECSCAMNREIAVYLTRDGDVVNVAVGTDCDVELTDYRLRRNAERLSCVRCVHTHPDGDGRLSDVDLSALKIFRYDAMTAIGVKNGEPTFVQTAFLGENDSLVMDEPVRWYKVPDAEWMDQIAQSDMLVGRLAARTVADERERAVLMGIESRESLEELLRLAETAGAEVVGSFLQKRDKPDSALYIGKGRAEELARDCQALEADVCIFDEELTGVQARNLEEILRIKVIDRTTLILDIFAQRASSVNGAGGNDPDATADDEFFSPQTLLDPDRKSFFDLTSEGFSKVFDLNIMGTLVPTQVFARDMAEKRSGCILNVSSMNAFTPLTKIPAYSAAKAGVSNFTQWLAVHFAKSGIRCNAIAPGFFSTAQNKKLLWNDDGTPTARTGKILSATPMGRFGEPEELIGSVLFLLDERCSGFITGVVLPIDGGFNAYSGV